MDDVKLR